MKWILIFLLVISTGIYAHTPVGQTACQLIFMSDGEVLLAYDGHLYDIAIWHSQECSCGIIFEIDDPDD